MVPDEPHFHQGIALRTVVLIGTGVVGLFVDDVRLSECVDYRPGDFLQPSPAKFEISRRELEVGQQSNLDEVKSFAAITSVGGNR